MPYLNLIFEDLFMIHSRYVYLLFLAGCLLTTPVFAQKANITKAAKTAAEKSAKRKVENALQATVRNQWKTQALQEAKQTDRLFSQVILKANQAQLAQLVDIASFRMYNDGQGIISTITDMWSELLTDLHISYFGPREVNPVSPLEVRKNLLQSEARLNHALKKVRELKPVLLKTAVPAQYTQMATPHTATSFFFETSPKLDNYSKEIALYISGHKDAIHMMANGQAEIEALYRKMLAFAHGKGAFPFRLSEAYRILALHEYPAEDLLLLQKNLNSLECDQLRGWGWSDREIRRVITLYRSENWAKVYGSEYFWDIIKQQHDFISSWRQYWLQMIPKDLENTQQLINTLKPAR